MKESCIRCGKETEYDVDTPVTERSCYIPKMGQMCFDCFCEVYHVPVMHGIYSFKRINGNQVQPTKCDRFTPEEVDQIQTAAFIMDRLFGNLNRSIAAEEALKEFKDEAQKPDSENPYELAEVDRRFRAFIFEWKLFTEHWKNYIYGMNVDPQYIIEYKKLYKETISAAFQKQDFIVAHVIRNYVSHANDAIDSSHIGDENKFWIHKTSLLNFLDDSIAKEKTDYRKNQLMAQKPFIEACEDEIDLEVVADNAMKVLREIQEPLMSYQLDQEIIDSCLALLNARGKIEVNDDEIWEIWKLASDQSWVGRRTQMTTLQGQMGPFDMTAQYGHIRLNWIGYEAIASYIIQMWRSRATADCAKG